MIFLGLKSRKEILSIWPLPSAVEKMRKLKLLYQDGGSCIREVQQQQQQ